MPEISKYVHVNSLGTAQLLEIIREKNLPIKKIIVASSQAVYSEGAGTCPKHGLVFPSVRPIEQLRTGDWEVHCPICGAITAGAPTPENAPVGGETVYGLTKVDQEKLALLGENKWNSDGRSSLFVHLRAAPIDIQSLHRRHRDLCTRLLNNLPPICTKTASRRATSRLSKTLRAQICSRLRTDNLDGLTVNVGSGEGTSIRTIAEILARLLKIDIKPEARGEFRPGEMRHLTSDTKLVRSAGYNRRQNSKTESRCYIDWIRSQSDIRDYFSEAEQILKSKGHRSSVEVRHA